MRETKLECEREREIIKGKRCKLSRRQKNKNECEGRRSLILDFLPKIIIIYYSIFNINKIICSRRFININIYHLYENIF